MKSTNYAGIAGALLIIAGGFLPMLRLPIIGNWNYWDIEVVLASIVYFCAALGIVASATGRTGLLKVSGWGALVVVLFTLIAVYFKVNDSFSVIPFKKLASVAAGLVKYRWVGWFVLIIGALLMIIGGKRKQEVVVKV